MARRKKPPVMTALQWDTGTDWKGMLEFIKDKASPRKMRLFGVACCRRVAHLFHVGTCGKAVDVAESFADGLASDEQRASHHAGIAGLTEAGNSLAFRPQLWRNRPACMSALTVCETLANDGRLQFDGGATIPYRAAQAVYDHVFYGMGGLSRNDREPFTAATAASDAEVAAQLALIREVFGNPLRPVAFEPAWRTEAAVGLATGIYDDKAFERMPILADALEEAGCDNADILSHCREPGIHVRGCWVVDLVLGKS